MDSQSMNSNTSIRSCNQILVIPTYLNEKILPSSLKQFSKPGSNSNEVLSVSKRSTDLSDTSCHSPQETGGSLSFKGDSSVSEDETYTMFLDQTNEEHSSSQEMLIHTSSTEIDTCKDYNMTKKKKAALAVQLGADNEKKATNHKNKKSTSRRRTWTAEDDELLKTLGLQYKNDWKKIVKRLFTLRSIKKNPNFLRNRFKELTKDAAQKRIKFSHQEDVKLAKLIQEHGMNWMKLGEFFPERTPIMLKNRYYSYIRKKNLLATLNEEANFVESLTEAHEETKPVAEVSVPINEPEKVVDFNQINQTHFELGAPSPVHQIENREVAREFYPENQNYYIFNNPMQFYGSQYQGGLMNLSDAYLEGSVQENSYFPFLNSQFYNFKLDDGRYNIQSNHFSFFNSY